MAGRTEIMRVAVYRIHRVDWSDNGGKFNTQAKQRYVLLYLGLLVPNVLLLSPSASQPPQKTRRLYTPLKKYAGGIQ